MIYRAFRRSDTKQFFDALVTSASDKISVPAADHVADLARSRGVAANLIEVVEGPTDPRSGALLAAPPPPATDADNARTQLDQIIDKAKQVQAGGATFTAAELQKIAAGLVLRSR